MSSASPAVTPSIASGPTYFVLRRLHSLTGLVFGGYIIVHLLVNASLIQGGQGAEDMYQVQVNKIHSLPFLLAVEWAFIFLPIIYHTIYGIWIWLNGQMNAANYPYAKNIFYTLQRISAAVIVAFMVVHVLGMRGWLGSALAFDHHHATATALGHIRAHWALLYILYPVGILASCYHLANGFWTAAITWGLTISSASQRRWGLVCTGLFVFSFLCGMTAWGVAAFGTP